MSENQKPDHKINTDGGTYIGGGVNTGGGDFVGRDQNKISISGNVNNGIVSAGNNNTFNSGQRGATLAELADLIAEIRGLTPQAVADPEIAQEIEQDLQKVEKQLAVSEPKKEVVLAKLESAAKMLVAAATAGEAIQKLRPMLEQAGQWAQQWYK